MRPAIVLILCLMAAAPVGAQIRPQADGGDARLQRIDYDPGQIVQLFGAPGYQLTVMLAADEQVMNVALGDSSAWQVNINRAGNHLFLKPTAGVATNMTVITSVRVYNFDLQPLPMPVSDMPWTVRFDYPAEQAAEETSEFVQVSDKLRLLSRYRIGGDRILRPASVSSDADHTFIRWPEEQPIPAVFEIGLNGEERLVNGGMRGPEFVVDGVPPKLVFRIDGRAAYAVRIPPKKARRR